MTATTDPFWNFSVRVYARPGVAETCLALQDEQGLDVNLLLLCAWSGLEGPGTLDRPALTAALAAVHDWQRQVVQPLRRLRRQLRLGLGPVPLEDCQAVRDAVAAAELQAEQVEQRSLAAALAGLPSRDPATDGAAAAGANLRRYVELSGVALTPLVQARLDSLVKALL